VDNIVHGLTFSIQFIFDLPHALAGYQCCSFNDIFFQACGRSLSGDGSKILQFPLFNRSSNVALLP